MKEMASPPTTATRRPEWTDVVATVLLALAAVATAWSSYQASRWNGEQAKAGARANAARIEAARSAALATGQTQVDIATFIQWVDATAHDDTELAQFYEHRFRDEFSPAFNAWLATDPLTNPDAPRSPFAMDEYRLAATVETERLDVQSDAMAALALLDIQRSSNYVLGVVMFAVALFFAGVSTKLPGSGSRRAVLIVGCVIFLGTAAWIATFPVTLSI